MEVIGSICAIVALGAFLGIVTYEWLLWRKRTLVETAKFEAEADFYRVAAAALADEYSEADYE